MNQERIGKFIAQLRKEKGWTQEEFAERLSVSSKTISRWENGNYMPDISILEIICNELGITVSEFLKGGRIKEEEIITESNRNILSLLELKNKEKRKYKIVFYIGIFLLVILIILCILQSISIAGIKYTDNDDKDTLIWFKDGIYINDKGVEITPFGSRVLNHCGYTAEEKREVTEDNYQECFNNYYSELEIIHYYDGFTLLTDKTDDYTFIGDSRIRIRKLIERVWPFIGSVSKEVEDEYYCFLGLSKYETFILSKYENNKCNLDADICGWLKQEGTKPEFDVDKYCQ